MIHLVQDHMGNVEHSLRGNRSDDSGVALCGNTYCSTGHLKQLLQISNMCQHLDHDSNSDAAVSHGLLLVVSYRNPVHRAGQGEGLRDGVKGQSVDTLILEWIRSHSKLPIIARYLCSIMNTREMA